MTYRCPRRVEQQPPLGRGDQPARPVDGVDVDRDRVDAGAHEQLGVLGVHRRRLAADRGLQAERPRPRDQLPQVVGDGGVALVEHLGEQLGVAVGAEQQLGQVVRADRDAGDAERRRSARG